MTERFLKHIDELCNYNQIYITQVANKLEKTYASCYHEDMSELIQMLGKFGMTYSTGSMTNRQIKLSIKSIAMELCSLCKICDMTEIKYYIKYNSIGSRFIANGKMISLVNTDSAVMNLFRLSNKTYNKNVLEGIIANKVQEYTKTCARHIGKANQSLYKTNSYSKSLGVCLFKYLGKASLDRNGNAYFTMKISRERVNSITYEGKVLDINRLIANPSITSNEITNIVIDASNPLPDISYNELWGLAAADLKIDNRISPLWDREVLVFKSNCTTDVKLSIVDMIHLMLRYQSKMHNYNYKLSLDDMIFVTKFIELLEECSEVTNNFRVGEDTLSYLKSTPNEELINKILNMIDLEVEPYDFYTKDAWGDTAYDAHIGVIRVMSNILYKGMATKDTITEVMIKELKGYLDGNR